MLFLSDMFLYCLLCIRVQNKAIGDIISLCWDNHVETDQTWVKTSQSTLVGTCYSVTIGSIISIGTTGRHPKSLVLVRLV